MTALSKHPNRTVQIYFLRHGEADWPDWRGSDDERPLTPRGEQEMGKVAAFLKRLDLDLDHILSSPLPRARQTANIVASALKLPVEEEALLAPGFDHADLEQLLQSHTGTDLMLVGHEPDFSDAIRALTGASVKLSKAGIALVETSSSISRGRLLWLFPPKIPRKAL